MGFGRVISDKATFAWICDVYVLPDQRGHWLVQAAPGKLAGRYQRTVDASQQAPG